MRSESCIRSMQSGFECFPLRSKGPTGAHLCPTVTTTSPQRTAGLPPSGHVSSGPGDVCTVWNHTSRSWLLSFVSLSSSSNLFSPQPA